MKNPAPGHFSIRLWVIWAGVIFSTGCSSADEPNCNIGSEGCACTTGGACDGVLSCFSNICVSTDGDVDTDSNAETQSADTESDTDSQSDVDTTFAPEICDCGCDCGAGCTASGWQWSSPEKGLVNCEDVCQYECAEYECDYYGTYWEQCFPIDEGAGGPFHCACDCQCEHANLSGWSVITDKTNCDDACHEICERELEGDSLGSDGGEGCELVCAWRSNYPGCSEAENWQCDCNCMCGTCSVEGTTTGNLYSTCDKYCEDSCASAGCGWVNVVTGDCSPMTW